MSYAEVLYIAGALIVMLLSVIGWLFTNKLKSIDDRMTVSEKKNTEIEKKQNEIQFNYLSRFEEVKTMINDNHIEQMRAMNQISLNCAACNKD